MKTKGIPAVVMLLAGFVTCIIGIVQHMETDVFIKTLLAVLIIFYVLGVDMAAAILSVPAIEFGLVGDRALLIETEICADVAIRGYFILMPEQESYYKILSALGLSL